MLKKNIFSFLFLLLFMLVNCLQAQYTVKAKLGPANLTTEIFGYLESTQVLLNDLFPCQKYTITIFSGPDSSADLLGLKEINVNNKPAGFYSSIPIITSSNYLMGRNNDGGDSINDILNKNIGVLRNSVASQELNKLTGIYNSYKSISSLYSAYVNNKIDYIIAESAIAKRILNNTASGQNISIINEDLFKSHIGFWVNQSEPSLGNFINDRIKNFKDSENYETFKKQYLIKQKDYISTADFYSIAFTVLFLAIALRVVLGLVYKKESSSKENVPNDKPETNRVKNSSKENVPNYKPKLNRIKNSIQKYISHYKLELNGIMQIRPLPGIQFVDNEEEVRNQFRKSYAHFQQKHPNINVVVKFDHNSVKVRFNSDSNVKISNKDYLSIVANDIEDMLDAFPERQFLIDLSLSGNYSNIEGKQKFSIINHDTNVELVKSEEQNTWYILWKDLLFGSD